MNSNLKCTRCKKTFDKEQKLKRHGYYCRQKSTIEKATRKRSCEPCSKAKARCDSKLPYCSNCLKRGTECHYEASVLRNLHNIGGLQPELAFQTSDVITEVQDLQASDIALASLAPDAALPPVTDSLPSTQTQTFLYSVGATSGEYQMTWPACQILEPESAYPGNPWIEAPHFLGLQPWFDISKNSTRQLAARKQNTSRAETTSLYLRKILGSIPGMMLKRETFPEMIHRTHNSEYSDGRLPESLGRCMSIARLWVKRDPGNLKSVWKAIRTEHERFWFEHEFYGNWELLSVVQSLMVYVLMRFVDGENEHNDFDTSLLTSLHRVSMVLFNRVGGIIECQKPRTGERWKDWVFFESRRRIITIARVLNMLVDIDHSLRCMPLSGFLIVPLPSGKTLWEATDFAQWSLEFEDLVQERIIYGLTAKGQLGAMYQKPDGTIDVKSAEWEMWLSGVDAFWAIVMLAGNLI